jgi:hypothetical protein
MSVSNNGTILEYGIPKLFTKYQTSHLGMTLLGIENNSQMYLNISAHSWVVKK